MGILGITCLVSTWLIIRYGGVHAYPLGSGLFKAWRELLTERLPEPLSRAPFSSDIQTAIFFASVVLFPALLLALLLSIFGGWFWGLVGFAFSLIVLYYSCGRVDYDTELIQHIDKERQAYESQAAGAEAGDVNAEGNNVEGNNAVSAENSGDVYTPQLAYASYDRWFSAAFWFVAFGPMLCLIYRCISIVGNSPKSTSEQEVQSDPNQYSNQDPELDESEIGSQLDEDAQKETATVVLAYLDWLPSRLWGLMIALMGNFSAGWTVYREQFLSLDNASFLHLVSEAALPSSQPRADWLDDLLRLNDRVMVAGLILLCVPVIF